MSNSGVNPSFNRNKTGSWQPYIPQMGTAIGCRTGNEKDSFRIRHESSKYVDGEPIKNDKVSRSTASAFIGGTLTLNDTDLDNDAKNVKMESKGIRNKSSMGSSLIPNESEQNEKRQRGKSSIESRDCWSNPLSDMTQPKARCNSDTLKPPDNLGAGLEPHVDIFMDKARRLKLLKNGLENSTLGPGLIPIEECKRTEETPKQSKLSVDNLQYTRRCGLLK